MLDWLAGMGVPALSILFYEQRANAPQETPLAVHRHAPVTLYRQGEAYLLMHAAPADDTPPAIGVTVPNLEDALAAAWNQSAFDVFDAGEVGAMRLHLPAIRLSNGQLVYLIEASRADQAFMIDFDVVADAV